MYSYCLSRLALRWLIRSGRSVGRLDFKDMPYHGAGSGVYVCVWRSV